MDEVCNSRDHLVVYVATIEKLRIREGFKESWNSSYIEAVEQAL